MTCGFTARASGHGWRETTSVRKMAYTEPWEFPPRTTLPDLATRPSAGETPPEISGYSVAAVSTRPPAELSTIFGCTAQASGLGWAAPISSINPASTELKVPRTLRTSLAVGGEP